MVASVTFSWFIIEPRVTDTTYMRAHTSRVTENMFKEELGKHTDTDTPYTKILNVVTLYSMLLTDRMQSYSVVS